MATQLWKHMFPRDLPLFASFVLSDYGKEFEQWEFDVRVGVGCDPGPAHDPNSRSMAVKLSQLKIDAVGWRNGKPKIFEVKPDARLSAFGQILSYCFFWRRYHGEECSRGVITDSMTADCRDIYTAHGVDIHLVTEADTFTLYQAQEYTRDKIIHRENVKGLPYLAEVAMFNPQ